MYGLVYPDSAKIAACDSFRILLGHSCPGEGAIVLPYALPPIGAKLEQKIWSQQYVAMKQLLSDNA